MLSATVPLRHHGRKYVEGLTVSQSAQKRGLLTEARFPPCSPFFSQGKASAVASTEALFVTSQLVWLSRKQCTKIPVLHTGSI